VFSGARLLFEALGSNFPMVHWWCLSQGRYIAFSVVFGEEK